MASGKAGAVQSSYRRGFIFAPLKELESRLAQKRNLLYEFVT
jgi:hypothetical protein